MQGTGHQAIRILERELTSKSSLKGLLKAAARDRGRTHLEAEHAFLKSQGAMVPLERQQGWKAKLLVTGQVNS